MAETFTAYVTKYAVSSGIVRIEAELCSERMIGDTKNSFAYYHGDDWHRTPEAALIRAEKMRAKKIASLEKQAAKLRKLKFEIPS